MSKLKPLALPPYALLGVQIQPGHLSPPCTLVGTIPPEFLTWDMDGGRSRLGDGPNHWGRLLSPLVEEAG